MGKLRGGPDLVLALAPSITNVSHLQGGNVIVDSPTSRYACVLRKVLSLYGLRLENGDYHFQVHARPSRASPQSIIDTPRLSEGPMLLRGSDQWRPFERHDHRRHHSGISVYCRGERFSGCTKARHSRPSLRPCPPLVLFGFYHRAGCSRR